MLGKGLESLIPPNGDSLRNDKSHFSPKEANNQGPSEARVGSVPSVDSGTSGDTVNNPNGSEKSVDFSVRDQVPLKGHQVGRVRQNDSQAGQAVFQIEVDKIKPNPHQPRREFNSDSLNDLAVSIREFGILQPLVVSKVEKEVPMGTDVEYVLIAGERRLMAAKLLGLERVPAIVKSINFERERLEMAIIENLQRENLNPIESARAFSRLQDEFNLTQREIASRLGKSRESIANSVRLLDLPAFIQEALAKRQITETHGRMLLGVTEPALQHKLFQDLLSNNLTTRKLKEKLKGLSSKSGELIGQPSLSPELKNFQDKLASALGAPVKISTSGNSGKITINFYSSEELNNILDRLGGSEGDELADFPRREF